MMMKKGLVKMINLKNVKRDLLNEKWTLLFSLELG